MIPGIDKLSVKLGLVLAILTLLVGFAKWGYDAIYQAGVDSVTAEVAVETTEILVNEIEDQNEDTISLQTHRIEVENLKKQLQKANERVPGVDTSVGCPVSEFERMWNETSFTRDRS